MVGLSNGEKNFEDMCNRLDRIPGCDRQTDRQTAILPRLVRAMHTRRAVKIITFRDSASFEHYALQITIRRVV